MPIEGELVVRIESRNGRVTHASACAERPRVASRLFPGRPANEAALLARSLFAVCGRSQAIAARSALEAIRGESIDAAEDAARERAIAAETLQEHAWKVFVDTPRAMGRKPAIDVLAEERRAVTALLDTGTANAVSTAVATLLAWSKRALLGREPAAFLALGDIESLHEWMRAAGTPAASVCADVIAHDAALGASDVPRLSLVTNAWVAGPLAAAIDRDAAFEEAPSVDGAARETGPLARTGSHPLVACAIAAWGPGVGARFVARLVEMAAMLAALTERGSRRHGASATGADTAIAWVETARGLLVHRVRLDGERIGAYRIVAPTEWNFHRDGAFSRGAIGLAAESAGGIEARVRRLVDSLDPCVGVRYEASHA
jgi:coenzyme F420-reducing hydrogenase alpha subunit